LNPAWEDIEIRLGHGMAPENFNLLVNGEVFKGEDYQLTLIAFVFHGVQCKQAVQVPHNSLGGDWKGLVKG
jgi:hypothetical protein